jgi:hypothetical protein
MPHYTRASLLVAALLLSASCSDDDARMTATQPSLIGGPLVGVTAAASTVFAQPVNNPICPTVTPFNVSPAVVVTANSPSEVIVTSIRVVFTDTSGRRLPQVTLPNFPVTLPAPGPTLQFGDSRPTVRTFSFDMGLGCGIGTQGTVVIIVDTMNPQGRRSSQQVSVSVR